MDDATDARDTPGATDAPGTPGAGGPVATAIGAARPDPSSGSPTAGEPTRVFLGLGSNLGDRVRFLRDAVATLREVGLVAVSPVYETAPVGGPLDQDRYLNLVVELRTTRTPHELLGVCRRLEAAAGRVRVERWGARTLDVDVLWIGGVELDDPDLTVPHPRMWDRRFVVAPLHDLAPDVADDAALDASEGVVERRGDLDEL